MFVNLIITFIFILSGCYLIFGLLLSIRVYIVSNTLDKMIDEEWDLYCDLAAKIGNLHETLENDLSCWTYQQFINKYS
jgi:hypothetical protein